MIPEQIKLEIIQKTESMAAGFLIESENKAVYRIVKKVLREAYEDKCRAVSEAYDAGLG